VETGVYEDMPISIINIPASAHAEEAISIQPQSYSQDTSGFTIYG
jgi:hypothetical protein